MPVDVNKWPCLIISIFLTLYYPNIIKKDKFHAVIFVNQSEAEDKVFSLSLQFPISKSLAPVKRQAYSKHINLGKKV